MVVGRIASSGEAVPEVVFRGDGLDEAFHFKIMTELEFIERLEPECLFAGIFPRWAVVQNQTAGQAGAPLDGTTIDLDEPFIIRFMFF